MEVTLKSMIVHWKQVHMNKCYETKIRFHTLNEIMNRNLPITKTPFFTLTDCLPFAGDGRRSNDICTSINKITLGLGGNGESRRLIV